jgi:L-lactate dehydrogenase complex protein LldG
MSDRDTIFASIRKALDPLPERTPQPQWPDELVISACAHGADDTVRLFTERLTAAKAVLLDSWEALAGFLQEQQARLGYIDPELRAQAGGALDALQLETVFERGRVDDYAFGITRASGGIAESGTLILRDGDGPHRLAALAPWIHVAVLPRDQLLRTIGEAVATFGGDPSIVWVTGPSKTADIEGILIQGVHGPGVQACLLL